MRIERAGVDKNRQRRGAGQPAQVEHIAFEHVLHVGDDERRRQVVDSDWRNVRPGRVAVIVAHNQRHVVNIARGVRESVVQILVAQRKLPRRGRPLIRRAAHGSCRIHGTQPADRIRRAVEPIDLHFEYIVRARIHDRRADRGHVILVDRIANDVDQRRRGVVDVDRGRVIGELAVLVDDPAL